jgi:hypothetical protein
VGRVAGRVASTMPFPDWRKARARLTSRFEVTRDDSHWLKDISDGTKT